MIKKFLKFFDSNIITININITNIFMKVIKNIC